MIENLFVFDFDDTLARTVAHIGVARLTPDGKDDELFPMWLENHDLHYELSKNSPNGTFYYLPSEDFATYQKIATKENIEEITDIFDFTETASVDPQTTQANQKIVNLLKQAEAQPNSKVIIVTARGTGDIDSPFGNTTATNREDIAAFLGGIGADIDSGSIYPVGSSDPRQKAQIVKQYIERLNPAVVYFYDDNDLNLEAIAELCDEFAPAVDIIVVKVSNGNMGSAIGCP